MKIFSSAEVAQMLGLSEVRVRKAASQYATKFANRWMWDEGAIIKLKSRIGKRGYKFSNQKNKEV